MMPSCPLTAPAWPPETGASTKPTPRFFAFPMKFPGNDRGSGGVVDQDRALLQARERPVVPVGDRAHVVVVADAHHDEIGALRGFLRGGGGLAAVLLHPLRGLRRAAVVDRHVVAAFFQQVARHRVAHDARARGTKLSPSSCLQRGFSDFTAAVFDSGRSTEHNTCAFIQYPVSAQAQPAEDVDSHNKRYGNGRQQQAEGARSGAGADREAVRQGLHHEDGRRRHQGHRRGVHRLARPRHRARRRRPAARPGGRDLRAGILGQDDADPAGDRRDAEDRRHRRLHRRGERARHLRTPPSSA